MGEGEADREREGGGSHVIILAAEGVAGWRERKREEGFCALCARARVGVCAVSSPFLRVEPLADDVVWFERM